MDNLTFTSKCTGFIYSSNYFSLFQVLEDYNGTSFTMTFPVRTTLMNFPIPIINDTVYEGIEHFRLSLSTESSSVELGPNSTVEILDNDSEFCYMRHMQHNCMIMYGSLDAYIITRSHYYYAHNCLVYTK